MARAKTTVDPALLVPRFVHCINAMAEQCGLSTDIDVREHALGHRKNGEVRHLLAVWRGTEQQIRDTGFLPPSYHFPLGERGVFRFRAWRRGCMLREAGGWRAEIDCGELPNSIRQHGEVEVVAYRESTTYHGTRQALQGLKIELPRQLPLGRCWSQGGDDKRVYQTHRMHDGTYLLNIENEDVFKSRVADDQRTARLHQQPSHTQEPQSADSYRDGVERAAKFLLFNLHSAAGFQARNVPFRFDDETLDTIRQEIATIMLAIREGRIIKFREPFSAERLEAVKQAEVDPQFQRFLASLKP